MAHELAVVYYPEAVDIKSSTFRPDVGTETLVSCSVSLKTPAGALVGTPPVDGVNATNLVSTADAAPYAWYTLNPVVLGLPEPTRNTLYALSFLALDTNGKKYQSVIGIVLKPSGI